MKPAVFIIITVVVTALIGGGIYITTNKKTNTQLISPVEEQITNSNTTPATTSAKMAPAVTTEFKGKLTDLFTRAESQKCTVKATTGTEMTGNFYISSGRLRGESLNIQDTMVVDVVIKDNTMYFWTKKPINYGFKASLSELQALAPTQAAGSGAANQYQDVFTKDQTFDCAAWNLDESKFTLPSDINFAEISQ